MLLRSLHWNDGWDPFDVLPTSCVLASDPCEALLFLPLENCWQNPRPELAALSSLHAHQGVFLRKASHLLTLCPFKPSNLTLVFSAKQNHSKTRIPQDVWKRQRGWADVLVPYLTDKNIASTEEFFQGWLLSISALAPCYAVQHWSWVGSRLDWHRSKVYSQPLCSCSNGTLNQEQCLCEKQVWRSWCPTSAFLQKLSLPRLDVFSVYWQCPRKPCWQICWACLHTQLAWQFSHITWRKVSFSPLVILSLQFSMPCIYHGVYHFRVSCWRKI